MTQLKEFNDKIKSCNMKLVIEKTLNKSDLTPSQNRLSMSFKQVETHYFLTDEEMRILGDHGQIEVGLVGPNLQMFNKPMRLKIWNMKSNKNYVLKTNWCDFVEANKMVLKEKATIQVWSFRKDKQLCFIVVCVDDPVVNGMALKCEQVKSKRSSRDDQDGKKKKVKKVVGREIVSNEVMTELREFIDEIKGSNLKLVIQKTLFQSDLKRSLNRLNMPFNQVETHDFLTDEDMHVLDTKTDDAEIEVRLAGPNLQMFMKPMRLKIWNMNSNKNYVLKTNWCDFVEANKMVLKEKETIQVWSFRKDEQLCFAIVRVDEHNVA